MRRISWTFSGCSVQKLCVVFSQEIALRATEELQLTGGKLVRDVLQHNKAFPCEKFVFGENLPLTPISSQAIDTLLRSIGQKGICTLFEYGPISTVFKHLWEN